MEQYFDFYTKSAYYSFMIINKHVLYLITFFLQLKQNGHQLAPISTTMFDNHIFYKIVF